MCVIRSNLFRLFHFGLLQRTLRVEVYEAAQLRDYAASWWQDLSSKTFGNSGIAISNWRSFKDALLSQFQPVNMHLTARDKLFAMRQHRSVKDYAAAMRNLFVYTSDMSESDRVYLFMRGLKPHLFREVRLKAPTSFDLAVELADRLDQLGAGGGNHGGGRGRMSTPPQNMSWASALSASSPGPSPSSSTSTSSQSSYPMASPCSATPHQNSLSSRACATVPSESTPNAHSTKLPDDPFNMSGTPSLPSPSSSSSSSTPSSCSSSSSSSSIDIPTTIAIMSSYRCLTDPERQECLSKNLCFVCKKRGHVARMCPTRSRSPENASTPLLGNRPCV
ncbi:hypothetical protein CBR_g48543 [Chara braunii]|uniref:CCHC-type domain-containing protein n=1 Tax=Chara braunii TaxID=69332 RepID=A0A388M367_CHABU|nr:hypothetical protein CBR_g48543 [Chara braunii]|eukprot:GBG88932.1 hypothetical protein CBR_g48543 [Chara braunii]